MHVIAGRGGNGPFAASRNAQLTLAIFAAKVASGSRGHSRLHNFTSSSLGMTDCVHHADRPPHATGALLAVRGGLKIVRKRCRHLRVCLSTLSPFVRLKIPSLAQRAYLGSVKL